MVVDEIYNRVRQTVQRYELFQGGESVLVALSGGPDSMTLLKVLLELSAEYRLELVAMHIDHGLRSESAVEAKLVQSWCVKLGIPCEIRRIDVHAQRQLTGESIQEAARTLRYKVLHEAIESFADAEPRRTWRIAVGHTADDQAETVLFRLLRGSGPSGLVGIAPRRDAIVRPLIGVWREEVLAFCRELHLPYITDASNASLKYVRNRIRHELIPHIESAYNPRFRHALVRLADLLQADEAVLEELAEKAFDSPELAGEKGAGWAKVRAAGLDALPTSIARRVLRLMFHHATGRMGPSFERLEAARALAGKGIRGGSVIELGGHAIAVRRGPWIEVLQQ